MNGSKKTCPKCGKAKEATTDYFRRKTSSLDGLESSCKVCAGKHGRAYDASYRLANAHRMRARGATYRAKHGDKIAFYQASISGLESAARTRARYPIKTRARLAVYRAIQEGSLCVLACESCGLPPKKIGRQQRIEGHHWKGYEEIYWLDVIWLCRPCHARISREGG